MAAFILQEFSQVPAHIDAFVPASRYRLLRSPEEAQEGNGSALVLLTRNSVIHMSESPHY